jgi:long-subunit fatty acid transport protein
MAKSRAVNTLRAAGATAFTVLPLSVGLGLNTEYATRSTRRYMKRR